MSRNKNDDIIHPIDGTPFAEGFLREGLSRMAWERDDETFISNLCEMIGSCDGAGYNPVFVRTVQIAGKLQINARRSATSPDAGGEVTEAALDVVDMWEMHQLDAKTCHADAVMRKLRAALAARRTK